MAVAVVAAVVLVSLVIPAVPLQLEHGCMAYDRVGILMVKVHCGLSLVG